jgi:hypothetical protein
MGTLVDDFLSGIDAFLERSGMAPSTLGKTVLKDPNFVADVRRGRMPSLDLVQRINDFIASQSEHVE